MTEAPPVGGRTLNLAIGGMSCASGAVRVEKELNRMPGVSAGVDCATGKAHLVLPEGLSVEDVVAAVHATGYTAVERDLVLDWLRQRMGIGTVLPHSAVVIAFSSVFVATDRVRLSWFLTMSTEPTPDTQPEPEPGFFPDFDRKVHQ